MTQNEEKKQYKFFQTPKVLKKLDPSEWVLFTVLFDEWQMMKNEEGWFFRSEDVLSEDTGLSTATIYRRTKSLEEKGLILVKRHSDGKTKSKKYKSNDYKINIETVISLAPIESHQNENESHQFDEPTNNIPTNKQYSTMENNKIYNINIKTSEDITPDDGTLQDDEVENVFLNNSDDDWLSYEVKRSMTDKVNNDLKLNDMKKENEMSDNGTNAMNAISEQSERQAKENESSGCGKENEMTTSTSGNKNKTSKEFQNIPVNKSKVVNNENDTPKGLTPHPQIALHPLSPSAWDEDAIFGSGEHQNVSGDKLPTNEEKTRQNASKCPQIEFNRERMLELFNISAKETVLERFKEQLKEMDAYMQYLKKNDHFTYEIYLKEIWSWWNNPMNVWNSDFDFICVGNGFKRKYVA